MFSIAASLLLAGYPKAITASSNVVNRHETNFNVISFILDTGEILKKISTLNLFLSSFQPIPPSRSMIRLFFEFFPSSFFKMWNKFRKMWINSYVSIKIVHRALSSGFTQSSSMIIQWDRWTDTMQFDKDKYVEKYSVVLIIADRHKANSSCVFQRSADDWLSAEVSPWFNIETPTLSRRSSCPFRTAGQQANFVGNPMPLTIVVLRAISLRHCSIYSYAFIYIYMYVYILVSFDGIINRLVFSSCGRQVGLANWTERGRVVLEKADKGKCNMHRIRVE